MAEIDFENTDFGAAFKASVKPAAVPPTIFDKNPDALAAHKELAEKSGVPIEMVERNPQGIKGKVDFKNTDFGQYAEKSPVLHGKLTGKYGAIYADDHENLSTQEGFLNEISRAGSNIGKAASAAIPSFNQGVFGLAEAGAGVLSRATTGPLRDIGLLPADPLEAASQFFGEQRRVSEAVRKRWAPDTAGLGAIESGVYSGITSLAQQVPGIAASVLSGNPLPMLAGGAGVEGGQSFGAARDKSMNFWQSLNYGAGQAGIEWLTEKIPAGQLMKDLGLKSGFGRTLLRQLAGEIPGEQAATFLQDLNEQINLNPEKTMGDFIEARPGAALQTLVATMVATGGQVSVAKITEKSLDNLGKLQQKSKLKARSDSSMEEYINDVVKDGTDAVYVDADAFTTYFQEQGIDPEMAAKEILGDTVEYQQAMSSGTALKIPMGKYVTKIAPTKHNDFFAREVRREPDMMNGREADEFATEFEKTLEPQEAAEVDQIQESVTGKLTAIGYDQATAETLATQMARYFNATGNREGSNPLELYERFMDDIVAAEVVPGGAMEQAQRQYPLAPRGEWYGEGTYESQGGRLIYVTPDEYLAKVRPLEIDDVSRDNIDDLKNHIESGRTLDPLLITKDGKEDGRHRAHAAKELGIAMVPVIAYGDQFKDAPAAPDSQSVLLQSQQIDDTTGLPLNADGTVTVYHHTSAEKAEGIRKSGKLKAAAEPDVYVTTRQETDTGYGDTAVAIDVNPDLLQIDDEFPDGRKDFRMNVGKPRGAIAVKVSESKVLLQNATQPRGFMQIKPGRKLLIGLTSARDLSSFLHESGHLYLEVMRDVVADLKSRNQEELTDSQKGIVADSETLLKWLGAESFDKIEREHHEKWARGTEAYFMEGKAPSFALRQAFARFRTWMIAIYKTVKGLDVKLNDDIRAVFDRMFATDAEIEQARNEEQLIQTFTTAESMGATAREFELYVKNINRANMDARERLEQRIIKEWTRQREAWWKEESANVAAEVEQELSGQKDYQTLAVMQTGKLPDGTKGEAVKLSTEAVKALYDDKYIRRQEAKRVRKSLKKGTKGAVNPLTDDLKAMVAKWGGISREEANAQGIDPADFKRKGWGIMPMFPVDGGMSFDQLAEKMSEVGFFAGEDYTANAALDMVTSALRGDDVRTPEGYAAQADRDAQRSAEDEALRAESWQLDIQQIVADKFPDVEADGADRLVATRAQQAINAGVSTYTIDDILDNDNLDAVLAALDEAINDAKLRSAESEGLFGAASQGADYDFGEIPFGEEAGFESSAEIDAFFGTENTNAKTLRALRKLRVLDKAGMAPDEAAMLLGYSSGSRLVDMLVNLKPLKQAVSERTKAIMQERHGDLMTDAAELADAAREVVLNEYQEDVLRQELRAINDLQRKAAPFLKEQTRQQREARQSGVKMMRAMPDVRLLKTIASRQIAQVKYRDLKPSVYLAAMRKSGKDAMKYLEDQNYEAAAYFKQRQMLNIELYRESMRVKEGLDKGVQFARKFTDKKVRQRLGKTDYLDQIDQILERFDFTSISLKSVEARKSLAQFIAEQQEQGLPINLPEAVINEALRRPYKDMTAEELAGIIDGIRHIDQMSRNRDKLMKLGDQMRFDDVANTAADTIAKNAGSKKKRSLEEGLPQQQAAKFIDGIFASHRKFSNILQAFDREDGGFFFDTIIRPINEAGDHETTMRSEATEKLAELFKPYSDFEQQMQAKATKLSLGAVKLGMYKPEYIPEIGDELTKAGQLAVALNWGNAGNRQRLMDGMKLKGGDSWSESQVNAVLDKLTEQDWQFVQGVWDYIDTYWPQIEAMSKRVDGIAPEKVAAVPVVTKYGTFRGGYYPAKYSHESGQPMYMDAKEQAERAFAGATMRSQTKHGFREGRAAKVVNPIRLDLGVIFEHVNEVIHDLTHFEAIMDANRLLRDRRVETSIRDYYGSAIFDQLKTALGDIAAGERGAQNAFEQGINYLRAGVSIAAMGWSFTTAMTQVLGYNQSIVRIGHKWMARGIGKFIASPAEMNKVADWVDSKSEFMSSRAKTQMREINEIRNTVSGGSSKIQDTFFLMVTKMQRTVDLPTWIGAYEKYMAEGFDDPKSVAMADQAVIDAQGSGMIKDLATVQRGGPMMKLWTNFYSYFNTTYNMAAWSTKKTDFTRPKDAGLWLGDMLMLYTVPAVLGALMREAIAGMRGDDDAGEDLWAKLLREQATYLTGTMVGVREFGSAMFGTFGYEGPAGTRAFSAVGKAAKQIAQGEADEAAWKSINSAAGVLLHYPAAQVARTVSGFDAMIEGETVNPLTLIFGAPKE